MQKQSTQKILNESALNSTNGGGGFKQYPNQFPFNAVNVLEQSGMSNLNISAFDESILNISK